MHRSYMGVSPSFTVAKLDKLKLLEKKDAHIHRSSWKVRKYEQNWHRVSCVNFCLQITILYNFNMRVGMACSNMVDEVVLIIDELPQCRQVIYTVLCWSMYEMLIKINL